MAWPDDEELPVAQPALEADGPDPVAAAPAQPAPRPMPANQFEAAFRPDALPGETGEQHTARLEKLAAMGAIGKPEGMSDEDAVKLNTSVAQHGVREMERAQTEQARQQAAQQRTADIEARRNASAQATAQKAAASAAAKADAGRLKGLKASGVEMQTMPDGTTAPKLHPDGRLVYQKGWASDPYQDEATGRHVKDYRDEFGNVVPKDMEEQGLLKTMKDGPQAGQKYYKDKGGLEVFTGPDETWQKRQAIQLERQAAYQAHAVASNELTTLRDGVGVQVKQAKAAVDDEAKPILKDLATFENTYKLAMEQKAKTGSIPEAMAPTVSKYEAAKEAWEGIKDRYEAAYSAHDEFSKKEREQKLVVDRLYAEPKALTGKLVALDQAAVRRRGMTPTAIALEDMGEAVSTELKDAQKARGAAMMEMQTARTAALGIPAMVPVAQRAQDRVKAAEERINEAAAKVQAWNGLTKEAGQAVAEADRTAAQVTPALANINKARQQAYAQAVLDPSKASGWQAQQAQFAEAAAKARAPLVAAQEKAKAAQTKILNTLDPKTWGASPERGIELATVRQRADEWQAATGGSALEALSVALTAASAVSPMLSGTPMAEALAKVGAAVDAKARGLQLNNPDLPAGEWRKGVLDQQAARMDTFKQVGRILVSNPNPTDPQEKAQIDDLKKRFAGKELEVAVKDATKEQEATLDQEAAKWVAAREGGKQWASAHYGQAWSDLFGKGNALDSETVMKAAQARKERWAKIDASSSPAKGVLKFMDGLGEAIGGGGAIALRAVLGRSAADVKRQSAAQEATQLIGQLDQGGVKQMLKELPSLEAAWKTQGSVLTPEQQAAAAAEKKAAEKWFDVDDSERVNRFMGGGKAGGMTLWSRKLTPFGAEQAIKRLTDGSGGQTAATFDALLAGLIGTNGGQIDIDENDPKQVAQRVVLTEKLADAITKNAHWKTTISGGLSSMASFFGTGMLGRAIGLKMVGGIGAVEEAGAVQGAALAKKAERIGSTVTGGVYGSDISLKGTPGDIGFANRLMDIGGEGSSLMLSEYLGDRAGHRLSETVGKWGAGTKAQGAAKFLGKAAGQGAGEMASSEIQNIMQGKSPFEGFTESVVTEGLGIGLGGALLGTVWDRVMKGKSNRRKTEIVRAAFVDQAAKFQKANEGIVQAGTAMQAAAVNPDALDPAVEAAAAHDATSHGDDALHTQAAELAGGLLAVSRPVQQRLGAVLGKESSAFDAQVAANPQLAIVAGELGKIGGDAFLPEQARAGATAMVQAERGHGEEGQALAEAAVDHHAGLVVADTLRGIADGTAAPLSTSKLAALSEYAVPLVQIGQDGSVSITEQAVPFLPETMQADIRAGRGNYHVEQAPGVDTNALWRDLHEKGRARIAGAAGAIVSAASASGAAGPGATSGAKGASAGKAGQTQGTGGSASGSVDISGGGVQGSNPQGGATVARRAHNSKVDGSIPSPATNSGRWNVTAEDPVGNVATFTVPGATEEAARANVAKRKGSGWKIQQIAPAAVDETAAGGFSQGNDTGTQGNQGQGGSANQSNGVGNSVAVAGSAGSGGSGARWYGGLGKNGAASKRVSALERAGVTVVETDGHTLARLNADGTAQIEINRAQLTDPDHADAAIGEEIKHHFDHVVLAERWRQAVADGSFTGTAEEYRDEVIPEMLHDLRSRIGGLADPAERAAAADAVVGAFNVYFQKLNVDAPLATTVDEALQAIHDGLLIPGTQYHASVFGWAMELGRMLDQAQADGRITEETHQVFILGQLGQWVRDAVAAIKTLAAKLLEMGHPLHASEIAKLGREAREKMGTWFARGGTDVAGEALNTVEAGGETIATGGAWAAKNPRGKEMVRGTWALMPLRLLGINKKFGTDQDRINREQTGAAQRAEIVGNMTEENIPAAWGASNTLNDGSPIITPDGSVVIGNNRTMALRDIYNPNMANGGRAKAYEAFARAEAARQGLDGQAFAGEPVVLVRVVADTAGLERGELVKAANKAGVQAKSEADMALEHAAALDDNTLLSLLDAGEDGALNRDFLQAFARAMADRDAVKDSQGNLDLGKAEKLAGNAMLAALLRGSKNFERVLSSLITASGREGMKRTMAGVFRALPGLLKVQKFNPSSGILHELGRALAALPDYRAAVDAGRVKTVAEYLAQGDMFESPLEGKLLGYLAEGHSAAEIAKELGDYVAKVEAQGDPNQDQMFPAPPVDKATLGGVMAKRDIARNPAWSRMVAVANDISIQQFFNLAKSGKLVAATGEAQKWADGTSKTPLSIGANAGYGLPDIAHFYVAKKAPSVPQKARQWMDSLGGKDPADNPVILAAFDAFAADAAHEAQFEERLAKAPSLHRQTGIQTASPILAKVESPAAGSKASYEGFARNIFGTTYDNLRPMQREDVQRAVDAKVSRSVARLNALQALEKTRKLRPSEVWERFALERAAGQQFIPGTEPDYQLDRETAAAELKATVGEARTQMALFMRGQDSLATRELDELRIPRSERMAEKAGHAIFEDWVQKDMERNGSTHAQALAKFSFEDAVAEARRRMAPLLAKLEDAPELIDRSGAPGYPAKRKYQLNEDRHLDFPQPLPEGVEQPPVYVAPDLRKLSGKEYHDTLNGAVKEWRDKLDRWIENYKGPLVFAPPDPWKERVGFVSKSASTGKWRLTHFQFQQPTGHLDYDGKPEAVEDAIRYYRRLDPGAVFAKPQDVPAKPETWSPKLAAEFGEDWAWGWNDMGLPNMPTPLPDGHALLEPTMVEEVVQKDGQTHKNTVLRKQTAVLDASHPLVRAGWATAGETMPRKKLHALLVKFIRTAPVENADGELMPGNVTPLPAGVQPVIISSAGGGGAGKTTVLRATGMDPANLPHTIVVNADDIKLLLPEWDEFVRAGDGRAAGVLHEESSYLANLIRDTLTEKNRPANFNVVYDATMANGVKSRKLMQRWKANGFEVRMIAVTLDPALALERAALRAKHSNRWVPWQELIHAHAGFSLMVKDYSEDSDLWEMWDNSGKKPQKIASKAAGKVDVIDPAAYALVDERSKFSAKELESRNASDGGDESAPGVDERGGLSEGSGGQRAEGQGARVPSEGRQVGQPLARGQDKPAQLGLFDMLPVKAAAKAYVASLPDKKPAAVKKAAQKDGLGEVADDLFTFASKQPKLTETQQTRILSNDETSDRNTPTAHERPSAESAPSVALDDLFSLMAGKREAERGAGTSARAGGDGAAGSGQLDLGGDGLSADGIPAGEATGSGLSGGSTPAGGTELGGRGERGGTGPGTGASADGLGGSQADGTGGSGARGLDAALPPLVERPTDPDARNFVIPRGSAIAPRGLITKLKANIRAVKLLKLIQGERRNATAEEKATLVQFTGWGALSQAFDEDKAGYVSAGHLERDRKDLARYREMQQRDIDAGRTGEYYKDLILRSEEKIRGFENWEKKWGGYYAQIKEALTEPEWRRARASTINAHFTEGGVVSLMWDAVTRLGFRGGNVGEMALGIGHFYGLMPQELQDRSKLFGVEMDPISAGIAQLLYPEADIQNSAFQQADVADNSLDLNMGNVPFANIAIVDPAIKALDGPLDNLHDYYFAKMLQKTRPGGLICAISSAFTLDKLTATNRKWLAERADLVAAYRLPNDAFKENAGTDVVTDIIILRKKDGQPFEHGQAWTTLADSRTAKGVPIRVNEYFAAHPANVLGLLADDGEMFAGREGEKEMTVHSDPARPADVALAQAIDSLPADIVGPGAGTRVRGGASAANSLKMGNIVKAASGHYHFNTGGEFSPEGMSESDAELNEPKNRPRVAGFMGVRDALNRQYELELSPTATEAAIEENREELNRLYDAFKARFEDFHHKSNRGLFIDDPDYFRLAGAEVEEKGKGGLVDGIKALVALVRGKSVKKYAKADVFRKRVLSPRVEPTHADSIEDAMGMSLGWRGRVDVGYIAQLTGQTRDQVEASLLEREIVLRDPSTGQIQSREQYLSGNVRKKLEIARASGEEFARNVRLLEAAQPADVGISDIKFSIGATWIPPEMYREFMRSLGMDVTIQYLTAGTGADQWSVENPTLTDRSAVRYKDFDSGGYAANDFLDALLNMRRIEVRDSARDGGKVNPERTAQAQNKANELKQEFERWARNEPGVGERLAAIYNKEVNGFALRTYDGQHLTFPWASKDFDIFPDKKNTVWRAIQEGFGLIAHGVGGGKTIVGSSIALELRRLGLAKKPMIVVHNATLEQFADTIATIAPAARVLVGRKDELQGAKRKEFLMRIAAGDWDAVVVAHSTFNLIADDPAFMRKQMENLVDELKEALMGQGYKDLGAAKDDRKKNASVKQMVKMVQQLEDKIEEAAKRTTDTELLSFQQLGVDALIVDEVHKFKKMPFATKLDVKGIDGGMSKSGYGLLMRARGIQEKNGGRNVFTMTGTPVTNTLGEVWNQVRLVAPHLLKEYKIEKFDQFVSKFATLESKSEADPAGNQKMVERLAKIINLPEWATFFRLAADVKFGDDMVTAGRPDVKGGAPELVAAERTQGATAWVNYIRQVLQAVPEARKAAMRAKDFETFNRINSIPVTAYMASRAAAIDIRLIEPRAKDEPGSKVNLMLERAMGIYKATNNYKGTQVIFADSMNPTKVTLFDEVMPLSGLQIPLDPTKEPGTGFHLYDDIRMKLIKRGVPASEIAVLTDKKFQGDSGEKAKKVLWEKVNAGEVRFVLGSTEKLGTGVNMQRLMAAAHHLDVPWTPAGLEQRDGRVLRQGNLHMEMGIPIELIRYGMKDTLDESLWRILERKQRFIVSALSGKLSGREIEEDPLTLDLGQQVAILSGPYGQEMFEVDNRLRELNYSRQAHEASERRRNAEIADAKKEVVKVQAERDGNEPKFKKLERLAAAVQKDGVQLTVDGETFETKKAMLDAVNKAIEDARADYEGKAETFRDTPVPNLSSIVANGVPIRLAGRAFIQTIYGEEQQPIGEKRTVDFVLEGERTGSGFGRVVSASTLVSRLEELGEVVQQRRDTIARNLERFTALSEMKPLGAWAYQEEFDRKTARAAELVRLMAGAGAKADAEGIIAPQSMPLLAKPEANPTLAREAARNGGVLLAKVAFHGTPHEVDTFRLEKIGTGEGAQSYGWGLYYAENPEVAESYRKELATIKARDRHLLVPVDSARAKYKELINFADAAPRMATEGIMGLPGKQAIIRQLRTMARDAKDEHYRLAYSGFADMLESGEMQVKIPEGNTYTVTLDVEPEDLLDWDKPLSEQSEKVKARIDKLDLIFETGETGSGGELYNAIGRRPWGLFSEAPKSASAALYKAGIPGIRYLDQGSRPILDTQILSPDETVSKKWVVKQIPNGTVFYKGDSESDARAAFEKAKTGATYNYVIFDESKIRITHRNGEPVGAPVLAKPNEGADLVKLVKDNMGLAVSIAQRYGNVATPLEDVVSEARVALVKAARGWQPERGPFSSYAGTIIRNTLNDLFTGEGRRARNELTTLDAPLGVSEDETAKDNLSVDGAESVTNPIARRETADAMASAISKLPEYPRAILFGIMEGRTLEDIAEEQGVSKQAISKVAQTARGAVKAILEREGFRGVDADGAILAKPQADADARVKDPALKKVPKSSTQLTLNAAQAKPFVNFTKTIPDADIYSKADENGKEDYGRETEPHVTVLYGLLKHDARSAADAVAGFGPVTVQLGKLGVFESKDYDVLKVNVEGDSLRALNARLRSLPYYSDFDDYKPHLTLAYMKKGKAAKYVGRDPFAGTELTFESVTFSPPSDGGLRKALGRPELPLGSPSSPLLAKPMPNQSVGAGQGASVGGVAVTTMLDREQIDRERDTIAKLPIKDADLKPGQLAPAGYVKQGDTWVFDEHPDDPKWIPGASRTWLGDMWAKLMQGRKDVLERFAPGAKAVVEGAELDAAKVRAGVREMMERMLNEVKHALGKSVDAAGKLRRKQFVAELLPTAARLNATGYDADGNPTFSTFEMRAGVILKHQAEKSGIVPGQWLERGTEFLKVGNFVEDMGGYQLYREMTPERQAEIYNRFLERYPETGHYLTLWIAPDGKDARVTDSRGTVLPEFNRHALREFFGEVTPNGELGNVEGYVPEISRTRSLAGMVGTAVTNLLNKNFKSGAREYKSGQAREEGKVKDIFQGFAIRAMEAHAEAQRLAQAEKLIPLALKPIPQIGGMPSGWISVNEYALPRLADAYAGAQGMTKDQLMRLSLAVSEGDMDALQKIVGKAWAELKGNKMMRKEVYAELVRPLADKTVRNGWVKAIDTLSKSYTAGLLSHPFSWIQNQVSNEIFKMMRAAQRAMYAVAVRPVNVKESNGAFRESWELVKLFFGGRFWNRKLIQSVVVPEMFDGNTSISGAARNLTEESMTAMDFLKQGNVPQALLTAAGYQQMDIRAKQQLAYASYIAQASTAAEEAEKQGFKFANDAQRVAWMRNWLNTAPANVHRRAYNLAVAYAMDYSNVPWWMDPDHRVTANGLDITASLNVLRRLVVPFIKWPYNMARQMKRFGLDSSADVLAFIAGKTVGNLPGVTGEAAKEWAGRRKVGKWNPRMANSVAHLGTYALMLGVMRAWLSGGGDDDELDKLGRSFDRAGRRLDRAHDTSSTVNISDLPVLGAAVRSLAKMFGDEKGTDDYWMRVRTLPYASPMLAMAAAMGALQADAAHAPGMKEEAWTAFREFIADFQSEGVLLTMWNKIKGSESKYNAGQSVATAAGAALTDFVTSRILPPPIASSISAMVDPQQRRLTPSPSLGYDPGFMEGVKARIPGLTKSLPPMGTVKTKTLDRAIPDLAKLDAAGEKNASKISANAAGKLTATYVDPEDVRKVPRWRTLLRFGGLNVKAVDRESYKRAVEGTETDYKRQLRKDALNGKR